MKKILITGANSYIGTSFEKWIEQWQDQYTVDTIDLLNDKWRELSFQDYDAVLHVAAIVHLKEKNISKYYKVNCDLALEVAEKAKENGVSQFIFLSTMGVYGNEMGRINEHTIPNPKTPYAKSKFEAENRLREIETENFQIAILRPPIVYGRNCKGNYDRLAHLILKMPLFPLLNNERSMLYIDNLSEFIRLIVDASSGGLYFPQNKDYVNVTKLAEQIAKVHGKKLRFTKLFNFMICIGIRVSGVFRKVFGSFLYDKNISGGPNRIKDQLFDYDTISFEESIERTESR